jgi:MoaA/NifB/PqqE/SkfB family radical SAM enzyme
VNQIFQRIIQYGSYSKYLFSKKKVQPLYLVLFLTHNCTATCRHCLLGNREYREDEMTFDEIEKLSKSMKNIFFFMPTGGDIWLRDDLVEIIELFYRNNRSRMVAITTNGWLEDKVIDSLERIVKKLPDLSLLLDVSIDAVGKLHDQIRGKPGIFERAVSTYKEACKLADNYPNLNVKVAVTISKFNQDHMDELLEFLEHDLKARGITTLLCRGTPREIKALEVDIDKFHAFNQKVDDLQRTAIFGGFKNFPLSDLVNAMKNLRHKIISETVKQGKAQADCYAGKLGVVIFSRGEVYPCETLDKPMGFLRDCDFDFQKVWKSQQANDVRKFIKDTGCFCTYECFLANSLLFNLKFYPKLLKEYLLLKKGKFTQSKEGKM